jgi:hypothetical protein
MTGGKSMVAYWRIRLKNQDGDFTGAAWERSEIGIWYGAWSAEDFRNTNDQHRSNQQIADILNGRFISRPYLRC